jgi:hypothetical protein
MKLSLSQVSWMALLLVLGTSVGLSGSIQAVPTDSRIYDDIDLLKTSGLIVTMPPTSRPWTRGKMAAMVAEADSVVAIRRIGPGQRAALTRLLAEFSHELPDGRPVGPRRRSVVKVPVSSARDRWAVLDPFSRVSFSRRRQAVSAGVVLANSPARRFAFYDRFELTWFNPDSFRVRDSSGHHIPGTRSTPWPSNRDFPGSVLLQIEHAYLAFKVPWLRLELGRDGFQWGPGYISSVMLSDNAPTLDHIQLCADYRNFKFLAFTSCLSRWDAKPRFLAAQRLEVSLWNRLTLGGAMMSVTSWDSLQPFSLGGIINPLIPIYIESANGSHVDNLLIGWDAVVYLPRAKLYGQLFVDNYEFNTRRENPNAIGLQAGTFWAPHLPIEVRLEYSRVTAFTYYHRRHSIMYENYLVPLGHEMGPDADQLYASVRSVVLSSLRVGIWGDMTRRGYFNRGGYLRRAFYDGEPLPEQFPALGIDPVTGDTLADDWAVDNTLRVGPEFEWRPLRDLALKGRAYYSHSVNHLGMPGETADGWEVELKVEYRY